MSSRLVGKEAEEVWGRKRVAGSVVTGDILPLPLESARIALVQIPVSLDGERAGQKPSGLHRSQCRLPIGRRRQLVQEVGFPELWRFG